MKNTIIISVLFLLTHFNGFGQSFVSENKLWSVISRDASGENMWKETTSYKFMGDTTFNQKQYKKFLTSSDNGINWEFNSFWHEINDSVFRYSNYDKKDEIIYNFNLQKSDSIYYEPLEVYLYVDSVCIKTLGKSDRKFIYLSSDKYKYPKTKWIQGIGLDGMITRSSDIGFGGVFCNILCFHEDGELVYQNPDYNTCYVNINTAVTSIENQAKIIEVYPLDIGLLTIRILNLQQGELTLFNMEGKQILQQKIIETETQICLPQSGALIFHFTSEKGEVQTGKIMMR